MIKFQSKNFRPTDTQEHFTDYLFIDSTDTESVTLISLETFT